MGRKKTEKAWLWVAARGYWSMIALPLLSLFFRVHSGLATQLCSALLSPTTLPSWVYYSDLLCFRYPSESTSTLLDSTRLLFWICPSYNFPHILIILAAPPPHPLSPVQPTPVDTRIRDSFQPLEREEKQNQRTVGEKRKEKNKTGL